MPRTRTMFRIDFVEIDHETDDALLIDLPEGGKVWFPKSQIEMPAGELWIRDWIYEQKDLDVEVLDEDDWDQP